MADITVSIQNPAPIEVEVAHQGVAGPQGPTGSTGATGATGATGPGVATGGSTGQHLAKASGTNFDTTWVTAPSHTGGLFSARPSATGLADGSTFFASDVNGGTLYRVASAAWEQVAPGVTEASGVELARVELTASPSSLTSTTPADVSGLTITFATGSKPAIIRAVFPQVGNNTAGSGARLCIHDGTAIVSDCVTDSAIANALTTAIIEYRVAANTPSKTYKIQGATRTSGTVTLGAQSFRKIQFYAVSC